MIEYWFKAEFFGKFFKVWQVCQGFNLHSILNQRDELFRELTGVKQSLEVWLLLKRNKSFPLQSESFIL
jgi:hypothetical protein